MKRLPLMIAAAVLLCAAVAWAAPTGEDLLRPYLRTYAAPAGPGKDAPPNVGDTREFWVWDMSQMPPLDKQISATCRGVSAHGYVFVDDSEWNVSMTQTMVDAINTAWDVQTPSISVHPDEGIYEIETSMFGPEYRSNGINPVVGPSPQQRKWYASVHVKDDVIVKVE